jgi:hypothetical protein
LTAAFCVSSPEFGAATEASIIESVHVTDRRFISANASDLDAVADLENRIGAFAGKPISALADFLASGTIAGKIDIPAHGHKPISDALTRRVQAKQKGERTAEQDAADFGMGFEVDGERVAPDRVRVFTRPEPRD